jgi:hypothetical protein
MNWVGTVGGVEEIRQGDGEDVEHAVEDQSVRLGAGLLCRQPSRLKSCTGARHIRREASMQLSRSPTQTVPCVDCNERIGESSLPVYKTVEL